MSTYKINMILIEPGILSNNSNIEIYFDRFCAGNENQNIKD